jgi:FlaA1/EpsC-like NDP-sugar epimerase
MRIWLIGAEQRGSEVLRQLTKNSNIEVIVSAPTDRPKAVVDRVIAKVDYVEVVTSVNINTLARRIRPDLILIDPSADPHNFARLTGGTAFADALNNEMATVSDYPCVLLS